jgi:hypothetical protein
MGCASGIVQVLEIVLIQDHLSVNLEWERRSWIREWWALRLSRRGEPGSAFGASFRVGSAAACHPQVERIDFAQVLTIGQGVNPAGATSMGIGTCGQRRIFDGDDECD